MVNSTITKSSSLNGANAHDRVSLSAEAFRAAFRSHPGGVAVITADAGDGPVAMTVTSVVSVSASPPLLLFSASSSSSSTPTLLAVDTLVVHLPGADQIELAQLGATSGADRFPDGRWQRLTTGEPVYPAAAVWIRCRVTERLVAGTSTIFVIEALESSLTPELEQSNPGTPLVYHDRSWHTLSDRSRI